MPKVAIYNITGKQVGEMELSDTVFGVEVNEPAMHQVVVAHLANCRQGTQSALTRSEVRGGGRKPWRQKGTGRARQGSTRSPQWRHGGVVFAPKPRSYRQLVNKKVRRLAMKSALSNKVAEQQFIVLDALELDAPKTRVMAEVLKNLGVEGKALVVTPQVSDDVVRAARNIPGVDTAVVTAMSVYDIMNHGKCIITRDAVAVLEEVYA
jgi:large subunit ribosomal protein L4